MNVSFFEALTLSLPRLLLSIGTHFPKENFIFLPAATCKKKRRGVSRVSAEWHGRREKREKDEIINIQRHKLSRYQMSHLKGKQRRDERTNINNRTDHPTRIQQWYHIIIIIIMTEWSLLERTSAALKKRDEENNGKSMAQNCQKVYELSTTKNIRFHSFIEKLLIELSILYASLSRCVL